MNKEQILSQIKTLQSRLDADIYVRGVGFAPATGSTRAWILSSIETLQAELPRASHDDLVSRFGWKSVERNA